MICDVLAGEQGPSCASLDQIPDLKVVHVRFIEPNDRDADENIMLVDMQGSGHVLFDPEITSRELLDGEEILLSAGNLSITAITTFIGNHSECNLDCTLLGL